MSKDRNKPSTLQTYLHQGNTWGVEYCGKGGEETSSYGVGVGGGAFPGGLFTPGPLDPLKGVCFGRQP